MYFISERDFVWVLFGLTACWKSCPFNLLRLTPSGRNRDNVSFHRALQVREWFNMNQGFINLCLPPYSPFLNPIEGFFSSWRWKVYERQPYTRVNLLQAMGLACGDIGVEACQAWIRHARVFFPRCLARQNVACDVDEVLWPDPVRRHDAVAE